MPIREMHLCQCDICQQEIEHPEKQLHQRINLLLSRLDEQQRRWFAAHESQTFGYGGDRLLTQITGMDAGTIARGRQELENDLAWRPVEGARILAGGRPHREKDSTLEPALMALVEPETAGDPMTAKKWVRSSLRHLARCLKEMGKAISPTTVSRLLQRGDYSLQVNVKREAGAPHPDRNCQFEYLASQRAAFLLAGFPVISVDTKKKELVGNFKNAGLSWCREPERVNIHDFPKDALGCAVPYGIYDVTHNRGFVCVGDSADTPAFAVCAIALWWKSEGQVLYPDAKALLILCDAGGSNGCRPHAWKQQLQEQLSDRFGLAVTICHYPTGCSKWNPIEYRLFSPISINWSGKPLHTFETVLSCIRGTTTETGLKVCASLLSQTFAIGQTVSKDVMKALNLHLHAVCPRWNYTFKPRLAAT